MACSEEQQQTNFKHFCRICRKGFMCGRALGGHMRAHGIGDESGNLDDEDPGSDWEDKVGGSDGNSNKRMYALRTNPNRLKSVRLCENCGKEFLSWKSFLEHGKCSSEVESLVSSPGSENEDDGEHRGCGWSRRKRSLRAKVESYTSLYQYEDEDLVLAKCLMALSNAKVYPSDMEPEESCASASKDEERKNAANSVTAFLAPLTRPFSIDKVKGVSKGLFECKACKKVFNSHQALGGHRASHKKVKGCFAARGNQFDEALGDDIDVITHEEFFPSKATPSFQYEHGPSMPLVGASRRKSKVHECSICHRVFSSGQALGGHKRCHWLTSNSPDASSLIKYRHPFHDHHNTYQKLPPQYNKTDPLDLNLPAPTDVDMARIRKDPWNPQSFQVSTEINLQSWAEMDGEDKHHLHHHHLHHQQQHIQIDDEEDKVINTNKSITNITSMQNVEDEADSKLKLAKLSEMKDTNINGSSSPWLQVGIGSTTDGGAD